MAEVQKNNESSPVKKDKQKINLDSLSKESHPILNIVLVGRTGNGKSATANSIIGRKVFMSRGKATGVTMKCQTQRVVTADGPILNIIDTPGLFDLSVSSEFISNEIVRCLTLTEGGIDAALLVLSARTRMSEEEQRALCTLQVLFGNKIVDYLIVVFSGGDVLKEDDSTIEDYLGDECPRFLKEVLILCGHRMIVFDNRTQDETKKAEQIHQLVELVKQVGRENKGQPYTNEMYHQIKEETDRNMQKQKEIESRGFSEEQVAAMKRELQLSYEQNLKGMSEMVEKTLKETMAAQERVISDLRRENDYMRNRTPHQHAPVPQLLAPQLQLPVQPCSIL